MDTWVVVIADGHLQGFTNSTAEVTGFSRGLVQDAEGYLAFALINQARDVSSVVVREDSPEADSCCFGAEQLGLAGAAERVLPFDLELAKAPS